MSFFFQIFVCCTLNSLIVSLSIPLSNSCIILQAYIIHRVENYQLSRTYHFAFVAGGQLMLDYRQRSHDVLCQLKKLGELGI